MCGYETELIVQKLSTEPLPTTMKYTKKGPRELVPFNFEEISVENIKQKHALNIFGKMVNVTCWRQIRSAMHTYGSACKQ